MMGDDISNMIIEGENRLKARAQIPEKDLDVNVYTGIPDLLRDNSLLNELKPPAVNKPPVTLPVKSLSSKTASPWLNGIYEAPVLTLTFKPQKDVGQTQYVFLVKDSHGRTFHEVKEKGTLPEMIQWDGVGGGGKPLHVGDDYTYSMSIIDEAGNPQRFAGKPFRLDSFRYPRSGRVVTALNPGALFAELSSLKLSAEGQNYLMEIKDHLRSRYGTKVVVVCYDEEMKFAMSRSNVVRDFLIRSLNLPEDKIVAQAMPKTQGDGYKHVDIIAE